MEVPSAPTFPGTRMLTPNRIWTDSEGTQWRIRLDEIRQHHLPLVGHEFVLLWVEIGAPIPRTFSAPTSEPIDLYAMDDSDLEVMRRSYATL